MPGCNVHLAHYSPPLPTIARATMATTAKLEDIGYGIQKLVMSLIVEDSGFGQDDITDLLYELWGEDGKKSEKIQSIEVPTMSKV